MFLPVRDKLQEASSRMLILLVSLEVTCKFLDSFRQDANLNSGRARVLVVHGYGFDNFLLLSLCKHDGVILSHKLK